MFPTIDQITAAKSWTELYKSMGLNPRNDRACKKIKDHVRDNFPNAHLNKRLNASAVSDKAFAEAVASSYSIRETLIKCGLNAAGAAYATFHRRVAANNLDTSHFSAQAVSRAARSEPRNLADYLHENGPIIQSHALKQRLIKEGLKEARCEQCALTEWLGKPIPITLDHINGNNKDNRIENLRILCPNCHATTPTFAGKKNRKTRPPCAICGSPVKEQNRITCGATVCLSEHLRKKRLGRSGEIRTRKGTAFEAGRYTSSLLAHAPT